MDAAAEAAGAEAAFERAQEAFARFDAEAAVAHLSAAVRGFTAADDRCRAAMTCVLLGDTMAHGLGNLTAGRAWFARARRLLEDQPDCVEQGWVAVAAMGCDVDDPARLLADAELALDRARRFGDVNLETKALADGGLAHVQAGRVAEGMALLDEAMALACGPADDASTSAKSVCSFFTACYHAADFDRAASWTELFRRRGLIGPGAVEQRFLSGHCDSVQAALLVELGRWGEAEEILTRAAADFEAATGLPAYHPVLGLADLRIRQGRLADAEALLLGREQAMDALLPGRPPAPRPGRPARWPGPRPGAGLRALCDDRLRALELLAVLVETELAAGDLEAASAAGIDLAARSADVEVAPLRARSDAVAARLLAATGHPEEAVSLLESTVDRLQGAQLPWLRATLLVDLARWRERAGDAAGARLDARSAAALLRDLDVVLEPADRELLERLASGGAGGSGGCGDRHGPRGAWSSPATAAAGRSPTAACGRASADSKGLRYLAVLRGASRVSSTTRSTSSTGSRGWRRRAASTAAAWATPASCSTAQARSAYRLRVEELRADIDEALEAGRLESAEALQAELDALVAELARAFGLGGRDRRAASAAERARLERHPRRTHGHPQGGRGRCPRPRRRSTGRSAPGPTAATSPADGELRWVVPPARKIVQRGLNGIGPN